MFDRRRNHRKMVKWARKWKGVPYKMDATDAFNCDGLIEYVKNTTFIPNDDLT